MTKSQELSRVVKMQRKAAKLSRASLAEMAGVVKSVIYDIENGKESIQFNTLRKILKVLNIRIELISPLIDNLQNLDNEEG